MICKIRLSVAMVLTIMRSLREDNYNDLTISPIGFAGGRNRILQ
jgi:hypothetical protein